MTGYIIAGVIVIALLCETVIRVVKLRSPPREVAEAVRFERDACAKLCWELKEKCTVASSSWAAEECYKAIRGRK